MKNNEQNNIPCLSIAQMGRLQELDVDTSDATFAWVVDTSGIVAPIYTLKKDVDNYTDINSVVLPAFGIEDMKQLLPIRFNMAEPDKNRKTLHGDFVFSISYTRYFNGKEIIEICRFIDDVFNSASEETYLDKMFRTIEWFAEKGFIGKNETTNKKTT